MKEEMIEENKKKIIGLLNNIKREGIENLIDYLENNYFFSMPSSIKRHHNWEGGLAQHCLGVYDRLLKTGANLPQESIVLTSLLHDICKTEKIYKNKNGEWDERKDEDLGILGHGDRSVKILESLGIELTPEEKSSIKWHMGGWKIGELPKEEIKDFFITKKSDLWRLLHNADRYDASHNGR